MRGHELSLPFNPDPSLPLMLQVARVLAEAIRHGRLRPGEALPGSRVLAQMLDVSRSTVVAAIQELESEGWVETRGGSGTYVTLTPPEQAPAAWGSAEPSGPQKPGFELPSFPSPVTEAGGDVLNLRRALPDPRLAPSEALAKAYQRAIRRHGEELLGAGEAKGNRTLRQVLAELLATRRGLRADAEQILITQGSRESLELVADCLLRDGGAVAVEDPGRPALWASLKRLPGTTLHPIPVDAEGMDLDALEALIQDQPLRLVVVSPLHQMPTAAGLSIARRQRLLELAREHRFPVLEIDYDFDYSYDAPPPLPLAAGEGLDHVIHLGSLSHLIAPSVHLNFLVGLRPLVDRLAKWRSRSESHGDRVLEWAVADLIRDEELARHLRRVRRVYQARRDHFAARLNELLGTWMEVQVPPGGLAFWCRTREGVDAQAWARACRDRNLLLHAGRHFSLQGEDLPFLRLGFGDLDEAELDDAARRLHSSLSDLRGPRRR